jgi:hypothetical protein
MESRELGNRDADIGGNGRVNRFVGRGRDNGSSNGFKASGVPV